MHEVGMERYQGSKIHLGQTRNLQVYGQAARNNSSPLEILFCKCMEQSHFSPIAQALSKKVLRHGQSCAYLSMVVHRERHMVNLWSGIELVLFTMRGCQQSIYICGRHSSACSASAVYIRLFHHD
jgi:hypothetical protein